jgi:ABC-2 type transport system permease protein
MGASLLHYRPWRGEFRGPGSSVWPIARVALGMIFRRKLFWVLYAFGLLFFFMFFFGQYLLAWTESQAAAQSVPLLPGVGIKPDRLIESLRVGLKLHGTSETYRNFFRYQASMVIIILAMTGSILVGNDFQFRSLPFYLAKPLSPWHYVLGKCLAVAVFINLMTTLPAIVLFVQYGLLTSWDYFLESADLLGGILAYGLLLTVSLSLILLATASWLKRTVPMIMAWTTLFIFMRFVAAALVDGLNYDPRWRLIDLWNSTYLLGNYFLGIAPGRFWPYRQPEVYEAALALGAVCLLCVTYLTLRIRAVEIVR